MLLWCYYMLHILYRLYPMNSTKNRQTTLENFLHWEKTTPSKSFLHQPIKSNWRTWTYAEAGVEIRKVAAMLIDTLPPKSNVAILSKNCAQWIMTDMAIMMSGHISVPIYPTLTNTSIEPLLLHSEPKAIFIGKLDDYDSQRSAIPDSILKISYDDYGISEGTTWSSIVKGYEPLEKINLPSAEEVCTIMYSSGTTGMPKGVMLTHENFGYVGKQLAHGFKINSDERFFSYLPLSHIAERAVLEMPAIYSGSAIYFAESLDLFIDNLKYVQPTLMGGVPRIWAKLQEGVTKKLPDKKLKFLLGIPIVGSLIKRKIKAGLGFLNTKVFVSGAAPIPIGLLKWYASIGVELRELYGMTENTAYSHYNVDKVKIGTVGQPCPEVEVKFGDDDEILLKTRALLKGYYKDPETTASVFTSDGFFKTGDRGHADAEGFLTITGRIKDQFKTDKGKFISPTHIEMKLLLNPHLEQACVVGMGVPQPIALVTLSDAGKSKTKEEVEAGLHESLKNVNRSVESYEQLECIVILKKNWTIENGLMTPSLKVKRNEIEKIYLHRYHEWFFSKIVVIWE